MALAGREQDPNRTEIEGSAPRRTILRLAGLLLAAVLLPAGAAALEELRFFRIGTAATTGTYFQIGGVLASAISKPPGSRDCDRGGSCGVPGLVAVAQATQGSVQNALAIGAGQLESALVQSDVAYWAYSGTGVPPRPCRPGKVPAAAIAALKRQGPIADLRAIAGLYPEDVHVVVRGDGAIRSLADLKGKRVGLGEPESGTLADARLVLEMAGLSECELQPQYQRLSQAAESLASGDIDAFFVVGGAPVPAIFDVASLVPIRLLPIQDELLHRLVARFPLFAADEIAAGTYPGVDTAVATASVTALWVVRADIDDDLVFAVTQALWREPTRRLLETSHPAGRRIRLATALNDVSIPLHPGAARYYSSIGVALPGAAR